MFLCDHPQIKKSLEEAAPPPLRLGLKLRNSDGEVYMIASVGGANQADTLSYVCLVDLRDGGAWGPRANYDAAVGLGAEIAPTALKHICGDDLDDWEIITDAEAAKYLETPDSDSAF